MMVDVTFLIRTCSAYDLNMKRDPARDDWDVEAVGWLPEEMVEEFGRKRYPKALELKWLPTEKAIQAGLLFDMDRLEIRPSATSASCPAS